MLSYLQGYSTCVQSSGSWLTCSQQVFRLREKLQNQVIGFLTFCFLALNGLVQTVSPNGAEGLVDDDGKVLITSVADGVTHEGELLNGGDDDALAILYVLPISARSIRASKACSLVELGIIRLFYKYNRKPSSNKFFQNNI